MKKISAGPGKGHPITITMTMTITINITITITITMTITITITITITGTREPPATPGAAGNLPGGGRPRKSRAISGGAGSWQFPGAADYSATTCREKPKPG